MATTNRIARVSVHEPQPLWGDPTPEQIAERVAEIHAGWSKRRRRNRHAFAEFQVRQLTRIRTGSRHS
ncbi:MAG: hypothetical protein KGR24_07925 [Planctomycetes bacterium]|nr:hypothetical protein [Planctomycetota bacterium]